MIPQLEAGPASAQLREIEGRKRATIPKNNFVGPTSVQPRDAVPLKNSPQKQSYFSECYLAPSCRRRLVRVRFRAKRQHLERVSGPLSGNRNLVLTVSYVPYSLDSGWGLDLPSQVLVRMRCVDADSEAAASRGEILSGPVFFFDKYSG